MKRLIAATLILASSWTSAAEPSVDASQLPRIAPKTPKEALSTFEIRPGFRIELVASEPLIADPVAFAFDEFERLFVVEMIGYPEKRNQAVGRVSRLVDTDGDGRYDESTVYLDRLRWPTGIACFNGGIFVCATPDIIYARDEDGDGRADEKRVVFTGFGKGKSRLNMQALVNGLKWGPDLRIYGATAANGGTVNGINLSGKDFSFDPWTEILRAESGTAQYGLAFDSRGQRFVCSNSRHIQAVMYPLAQADVSPFYRLPPPLANIANDGAAAPVYRSSPDEPWRVIRTQWRVAGLVGGPVEGGGRPSGYFTSATGIAMYRGRLFGRDYLDDAFIADVGSNLIHHKRIRNEGTRLIAERLPGEGKTEFLRSSDTWFRPVFLENGPEGALYFADMYREVIEHPWSLPNNIKEHLDLYSGSDRGRIYRIVPDAYKACEVVTPGKAPHDELGLMVGSDWRGQTAGRLLAERKALKDVGALGIQDYAQVLHVRQALGLLDETYLGRGLDHHSDLVREQAVHLTASFPDFTWSEVRLQRLAADESPWVRLALAMRLAHLPAYQRPPLLDRILTHSPNDTWIRHAGLQALTLKTDPADFFDFQTAKDDPDPDLLQTLAEMMGKSGHPPAWNSVLDFAEQRPGSGLSTKLLIRFGEGARETNSKFKKATRNTLNGLTDIALASLGDETETEGARIQAIRLLALASPTLAEERVLPLLTPTESPALQEAALKALSHLDSRTLGKRLVDAWSHLTPRIRPAALEIMLRRPADALHLIEAVEANEIPMGEVALVEPALVVHSNERIRNRVQALIARTGRKQRSDVIESYRPALSLKGDAKRGAALFKQHCAVCHEPNQDGALIGPPPQTFKQAGKESMLTNLFDPNREVAPQYKLFLVSTKAQGDRIGMIVSETPATITLRNLAGRDEVLQRTQIESFRSAGSIMPEGLESGLSIQDTADLLEFLTGAPPP